MATALVQHGDGLPVFVDADKLEMYLNHGYRLVGTAAFVYSTEVVDDTTEAIVTVVFEPAVAAEELAIRTFEADVDLAPAIVADDELDEPDEYLYVGDDIDPSEDE